MGLRSWISWKGQLLVARPLSRIFWPPSSAAAVVVKDGKILVIDTGDYLMLPGGTCERGEKFEETVVREVKEETGLEVEPKKRINETVNSAGGNEVIFLAKPVSGSMKGNWEGEALWIDKEEVDNRRWRFDRDVSSLVEKSCEQR